MTKAPHRGFASRHVFIDTSVFYSESMNLRARLFNELARLCEEIGFKVHVPDIVLGECRRRLDGMAAEMDAAARKYAKAAKRWNAMGSVQVPGVQIEDAEWNAERRMLDFETELRERFNLVKHGFREIDPVALMENYFSGLPPFDGGSKEFPDAMIVQIASSMSEDLGAPVYLLTGDAKMTAAAVVTGNVIPLPGLAALLQIAAEIADTEVTATIEAITDRTEVWAEMLTGLSEAAAVVDYRYLESDVEDVEVTNVHIIGADEISAFSPIRMTSETVSFVCTLTCTVLFDISYVLLIPDDPADDEDSMMFWGQPGFGEFRLSGVAYRAFFEISRGEHPAVVGCQVLNPRVRLEDLTITREI